MKILGVTGGMGMGKTTVCSQLRKEGFPVFDADYVVHQLQGSDGKALPFLAKAFPGSVHDNILDRSYLRKLISQDRNNLKKIENIILPLVDMERKKFIQFWQGKRKLWCVLDIPLLFEKKIDQVCTKTLLVNAPKQIQKIRIINRGGISWKQAEILISHQLPNSLKCQWADRVIQTGLNRAYTYIQVKRLAILMKKDQL